MSFFATIKTLSLMASNKQNRRSLKYKPPKNLDFVPAALLIELRKIVTDTEKDENLSLVDDMFILSDTYC